MRVSNYVIGAPLARQPFGIILHGLIGAVDKVPRDLAVALARNAGERVDKDEDLSALSPADLAHLLARGYLTDLTVDQEREMMLRATADLHQNDLLTAQASMVLIPTYRCGLRCPYCFQSHDLHAGRGEAARLMSIAQVDQAFGAMDHFRAPGSVARHLGLAFGSKADRHEAAPLRSVGLFGGEPLAADTVPIVEHIVACATTRGTNVWAITNGVELECFRHLLGPDRLAWLQITFDGMASLHDSRRRGPQFRTTFDRIADNVDLALQRGVRVSVRMNVDSSNLAEIEPLTAYFEQRGWSQAPGFDVNAAVVTGESKGHKHPVTHGDLVAVTQQLADEGRNIDSYEQRARDTLRACLSGEGYPFRRVANCSAETGQLMFDPLGDVYSCWEDVGTPAFRIATYGTGGIAFDAEMAGQWLTRYPGAIEQCSVCPYALVHRSGCAAHARLQTGRLAASACEEFQSYFPATLACAYEALEAQLMADHDAAGNVCRSEQQREEADV